MDWQVILGWGSPIGLGFFFLSFGVFLWGTHYHPWQGWSRRGNQSRED